MKTTTYLPDFPKIGSLEIVDLVKYQSHQEPKMGVGACSICGQAKCAGFTPIDGNVPTAGPCQTIIDSEARTICGHGSGSHY